MDYNDKLPISREQSTSNITMTLSLTIRKTLIPQNLLKEMFSRMGPCESFCLDGSESVKFIRPTMIFAPVISTQSQNNAAKARASQKLCDVKKLKLNQRMKKKHFYEP